MLSRLRLVFSKLPSDCSGTGRLQSAPRDSTTTSSASGNFGLPNRCEGPFVNSQTAGAEDSYKVGQEPCADCGRPPADISTVGKPQHERLASSTKNLRASNN